ncbi:MAG: YkgJ family cysteine cluster protein [Bdellovibrionota bacterium]
MPAKPPWWHEGIRFECQGSGRCCVSRGQYGYVYVTLEDRRAMARHLGLATAAFTRKYCERQGGIWKLRDFNENCRFLEGKMCGVYEARPTQCRTWPFWPEVMNAKAWAREVAAYCPGVGKGRVWSREEIEKNLHAQVKSEEQYGN